MPVSEIALHSPITYTLLQHKGARRIMVQFSYNAAWNKRMQQVPDARWSKNI